MKTNLERAAPALLTALNAQAKAVFADGSRCWCPKVMWKPDAFHSPQCEQARAAIALARLPDIDPATGLPFNRDGEDE